MKAEHRKELETNVLADRLGRWVKDFKSGNHSRGLTYWVFGVLAAGIIVAWLLLRSGSGGSDLWRKVDNATSTGDIPELTKLAEANPGTIPARTAQFQIARLQLNGGMQKIASPHDRQKAADEIEQARDLYRKLAQETTDAPLLMQEALLGSAKAEESLIGVPKKDNPDETRGTLEQALRLYDDLAAAKPESFHTRAAADRAKVLRDHGDQIQQFYADLQNSFSPKPRD